MLHEKFYVSGTYGVAESGVFVGWTALERSFAERQPFLSERGDIAVLFSGECYADSNLLARLRAHGHDVTAGNGTWLAALYEEDGPEFVSHLNGLFSGLLIDRRQGTAILFNDRFGMERIYYHETSSGFFFASEAKALLRVLPQLRSYDPEALAEHLTYGCTFGEKTLFRQIRRMPPASVWHFRGTDCERRVYFRPVEWEAQVPATASRFTDELEATLARIVPRYFSSGDVGVSLTGGLDTRMIMACRPQSPRDTVTYTFAGTTGETLDAQLAALVAAECGTRHVLLRITDAFFSEFDALLHRTVYITDGSFGACGSHEIFLNRQARELAPVRLTGNFGSEVLRAVTTLKPLNLCPQLFDGDFRRTLEDIVPPPSPHPVSFSAFTEIPLHLSAVVRAAQSQVGWRTPYLDNEIVALAYRATARTRSSSAPSLQTIRRRHPRLGEIRTDAGLVAASWLRSAALYPWARVAFKLDYWYTEGLPDWFACIDSGIRRLGFPTWSPGQHKYLHYATWFRSGLGRYVEQRLEEAATSGHQIWNRSFLGQLARSHATGQRNYVREIDAVLALEASTRMLLRSA